MKHLDPLERHVEQKSLRRSRKRKPKMKVSGAQVRKLQRIILKKAGKA